MSFDCVVRLLTDFRRYSHGSRAGQTTTTATGTSNGGNYSSGGSTTATNPTTLAAATHSTTTATTVPSKLYPALRAHDDTVHHWHYNICHCGPTWSTHYHVLVPTTCVCCIFSKLNYHNLLSSMELHHLSTNGYKRHGTSRNFFSINNYDFIRQLDFALQFDQRII